jgi:voltage-gated potassium channel
MLPTGALTDMSQTAAQRRTLEILDQGKPGDWASLISDWFFITLVLANITAVVLESVSALEARYAAEFALFELVSVLIFSAEYLLRLWATGAALPQRPWVARRRYVFGFYGLVDVLSIVPYYLAVLVPGLDLRVLRVLRLLRVLKISHFNTALEDVLQAVWHERKTLFSAVYLLLIAVLLCSSIMYFAENEAQPEKFSSIPAAMYWAMITLTTVGYGDVSPVTWVGQIVSVVTAFMGVCTIALLTGVVASAFANQLERRKAMLANQLSDAFADGVLSDTEIAEIAQLKERLNLSDEVVNALIAQYRQASTPS